MKNSREYFMVIAVSILCVQLFPNLRAQILELPVQLFSELAHLPPYYAQLSTPRSGIETVVPIETLQLESLSKHLTSKSYRFSPGITSDQWLNYQSTLQLWPLKKESTAEWSFQLNQESIALGCVKEAQEGKVLLVHCL